MFKFFIKYDEYLKFNIIKPNNELFNFNLHDFREITIIAMKSAFLHHNERKRMIQAIAEEFEQNFGLHPEYVNTNSKFGPT